MRQIVTSLWVLIGLLPGLALAQLNVSIALFDPGIPDDMSLHRGLQVFPKIREIESLFLPFVLRETLVESGQWGAVRVIPEADAAAELLITATIARSDGGALEISLRAVDASGYEWVNKTYSSDLGYQELNDEIAGDLLRARRTIDSETLARIADLSTMRYASNLAPDAFGDYVEVDVDGRYQLVRLPAENDPMMQRIRRVRSVEYVMTDAIDQKFQELHAEIESVYDIWREYRQWYADFKTEEAKRNLVAQSDAKSGSYEAIQQSYDNYRLDRLAAQEQDKWAVGFNNEIGPTIDKIEARVAELNGWVEDGYLEWSRILDELFEIESSLE